MPLNCRLIFSGTYCKISLNALKFDLHTLRIYCMNFFIAIAAIVILIGLWNLTIAILGLFPQCRSTAVGTLTNTNTKKNFRTRRGLFIPISTRYVYTYTVNGRDYRYSGEGLHSERRLFPKASMVFVKWFPRRAYPNKFKGTTEWMLGLLMLFMGSLFLYVILFA